MLLLNYLAIGSICLVLSLVLFIGHEILVIFGRINFLLEPLSAERPPKYILYLTPVLVTISIFIIIFFKINHS